MLKKQISIILIFTIVLTLVLTGCGRNKNEPVVKDPNNISTGETVTTPEMPTDDNEEFYKYESEHLQVPSYNLKNSIKNFIGEYIICSDDKLYNYSSEAFSEVNIAKDFDRLVSGYRCFVGIKDDILYLDGQTSFYYNAKYNDLFYIKKSNFITSEIWLSVISLNKDTNQLIYQECFPDSTFKEYVLQFKVESKNVEQKVVWTETNFEIKQLMIIDSDSFYLLTPDGVLYDCHIYTDNNSSTIYADAHKTSRRIDALVNVDCIYNNNLNSLLYALKDNETEIYHVVNRKQQEVEKLTLPSGTTTNDIKQIYFNQYEEYMLLLTQDGSVYYSIMNEQGNFGEFIEATDLTELNKLGLLNELYMLGTSYHVLIENNIYKIAIK